MRTLGGGAIVFAHKISKIAAFAAKLPQSKIVSEEPIFASPLLKAAAKASNQ